MELDPSVVGISLRPFHAKVKWRHLMNYAAAIHDENPIYFDDENDRGLIAHPMFCVALTWPLLEDMTKYMDSDEFPSEILHTKVHYTEHLEFFRPVLPGDSLTIEGQISAVLPHRSGTHLVIRLVAKNSHGEPVFTEYTGALLRGVGCGNKGKGLETLPTTPTANFQTSTIWEKKIFIDPLQPYHYDGCTNIFFPIHTSRKFAHQVGLPGIILQGTATLALAVRELINMEAGGQPNKLKRLGCQFAHMVFPGTEISVRLRGSTAHNNGRMLFFHVFSDKGEKAISNGYAFLAY
jgi:acyl dehydratase